ncbi:MAG: hypothetical protein ACRECH_12900, partial [Nitrososphaerales archaeon]
TWMSTRKKGSHRDGDDGDGDELDEVEKKQMAQLMRDERIQRLEDRRAAIEDRQQQRQFQRQMNMMMSYMMMQNMRGGNQGMQGMGFQGGMPMITRTKPILDAEGKVLKDETGMAQMEYVYEPWSPLALPSSGNEKDSMSDRFVEVLGDALTSERDAKNGALTKLAETFQTNNASQLEYFRTRLDAMESSDPTDAMIGFLDKLKVMGVPMGQQQTDNLDIKKLDIDLQKWKHEQGNSLQKWIWEQKQTMADKQYARQQLKEFGGSVRMGIDKLGVPIATGFAEGLKGRGGGAQNQNGNRNRRVESTGTEEDVSRMSDDVLVQTGEEADRAMKVIERAKKNIAGEMDKRGMKV